MVVDAAQSAHAHAAAEFVQDTHARHLGLTAQTGKLSPPALLGKHPDQQVHGMHRGQQAQQMNPIKLCRTVIAPSSTRVAKRPAFVDEIIRHKRIEQFKQGHGASRRKVGIHVPSLPLEI
jgi:hypothetical protein